MYTFATYSGIYAGGALVCTVIQAHAVAGSRDAGSAAWMAWWLVTGLATTVATAAALVGAIVINVQVGTVAPPES